MYKLQNRLVWRLQAFVEGNPGNGSGCMYSTLLRGTVSWVLASLAEQRC